MDMSLFERSPEAVAAPRIDFATLVAVLGAARASENPASAPDIAEAWPQDASTVSCLVAVLLGRGGWRQAAQALGGRFAGVSDNSNNARKPL